VYGVDTQLTGEDYPDDPNDLSGYSLGVSMDKADGSDFQLIGELTDGTSWSFDRGIQYLDKVLLAPDGTLVMSGSLNDNFDFESLWRIDPISLTITPLLKSSQSEFPLSGAYDYFECSGDGIICRMTLDAEGNIYAAVDHAHYEDVTDSNTASFTDVYIKFDPDGNIITVIASNCGDNGCDETTNDPSLDKLSVTGVAVQLDGAVAYADFNGYAPFGVKIYQQIKPLDPTDPTDPTDPPVVPTPPNTGWRASVLK
jgi:hypothetical protein